MKRVISTKIYNEQQYIDSYIKYRWMEEQAFLSYFNSMCFHEGVIRILDLGCGTGQFSIRIAKQLKKMKRDFLIDAVDNSEKSLIELAKMRDHYGLNEIKIYNQDFMMFVTEDKYDLIICSEMIHLINDLEMFFKNICKAISPGGQVFIRTSSPTQLMNRSSYKYFPRCLYLDLKRNKGQELISATLALYGKRINSVKIIDESRYCSKEFYIELFKNKAFSTLHYLSEKEYSTGIDNMISDYRNDKNVFMDFEMTLYIIKG